MSLNQRFRDGCLKSRMNVRIKFSWKRRSKLNRVSKFDVIKPVIEEFVTEHPYSNVVELQHHYITHAAMSVPPFIEVKSCKLTTSERKEVD
jgi:hypothetical protein